MRKTVILTVLLSLLLFASLLTVSKVVQRVVARVNDQIITKTELDSRKNSMRRSAYTRYSGEKLDKALSDIEDTTLQKMIEERIFIQRAREMGMQIDQVVDRYLDNFKKKNKIKNEEELKKKLKQQNMNISSLREEIKRSVIPQIVVRRETERSLDVTQHDMKEYYNNHPEEFRRQPEITVYNIYISKDRENASDLAEKVSKSLKKGTAVMDVIDIHSLDSSMARPKTYKKGDLKSALEKKAYKLKPGETTSPVETENGFFVLKLIEKHTKKLQSFEEVDKEKIKKKLKDQLFTEKKKEYLQKLKDRYFIKIYKE